MHPAYTIEKRTAMRLAEAGDSVLSISAELRRHYDMDLYEADTIARQAVEAASRPAYVTEDGATVHEGDLVYDYYSMEPVIIGEPSGSEGWFDTLRPGSVDGAHPRGVRSTAGMLNGARICTMAFAKRRGFKGA